MPPGSARNERIADLVGTGLCRTVRHRENRRAGKTISQIILRRPANAADDWTLGVDLALLFVIQHGAWDAGTTPRV